MITSAAYTANGGVNSVINGVASYVPNDPRNASKQELDAWVAAGGVITPYVAPPLTSADYAAAVQLHIDSTAKIREYADGVACASYSSSTVPQWAADAAAFVPWRDSVWTTVYSVMSAVQAGSRPAPTIEALIAELPSITWPS
jgi:uncharacterized membrane protein YgcG